MTQTPIEQPLCPTCGRALPLSPDDPVAIRRRLGDVLRRHRIASGFTQEQVCEMLPVLSRPVLSRIETGDRDIDVVMLVAVCGVVGVAWQKVVLEVFGE